LDVKYEILQTEINSNTSTDWINGIFPANDTDGFVGQRTSCYYYEADFTRVTLEDDANGYRIIYTVSLIYACVLFLCGMAYFMEVIYHGRRSQDFTPLLQPTVMVINGVTLPFSNS